MAIKYLGETLDIHAGGIDLVFPHHENEIAQSESLTGKPFARFWLHAEFLMVEGQKMSKSLGNYFTLRDILERGYQPEAIRYLLASVPYRKSLNFTFDGLKSAATAIDRLRNFKLRLETDQYPEGVQRRVGRPHRRRRRRRLPTASTTISTPPKRWPPSSSTCATPTAPWIPASSAPEMWPPRSQFLARFDSIFDVLRPTAQDGQLTDAAVDALIAERAAAKKAKNFARADQIRQQLLEQGIILEDTKSGVRWKRK